MKMRFLLDEHLSLRITGAVLRHDPTIDIRRIGADGAPPFLPMPTTIFAAGGIIGASS